jgi:hypothetical protein
MQSSENDDQLFVIVINETYGGDESNYATLSENYRVGLENEFGVKFEETNIGPGFDIPAFFTDLAITPIPLWSVVLGAFFLGKPVDENLEAWTSIYAKLKKFLTRPVVVSRNGASVMAVKAVFDEIGGTPKCIRLLSYRPLHAFESDNLATVESSNEIDQAVPTINLGIVRHVLEIEADGQYFRVSVHSKKTEVLRVPRVAH